MGSFRLYTAAFIVLSFFGYCGSSFAADQTTIDEMKLQMEKMQNMIMQQQEQIKLLSVKLDNESKPERHMTETDHAESHHIGHAESHHNGHAESHHNSHAVSQHDKKQNLTELDKAVDERIKEFFETEESKELVSHNMPVEIGYDEGFFF